MILDEGVRTDGRTLTEIRPLSADVGLLPRVHGTGLFQRGQTQVLTTCTLGTGQDAQIIDDLSLRDRKRYLHHYDFPPYSVGEARPLRSPGRRDIGHGALAERALEPMIPPEEAFPYTLRLVSLVLESNGSTSMGSRVRQHAGADGCRRADQEAGRRHRDGPDHGRRGRSAGGGPHRHPGHRRRDGRHGLQGRRHARRRHGAPDGHQDQGAVPRHSVRGRWRRRATRAWSSWTSSSARCRRRARTCRRTRRGSSRSTSTPSGSGRSSVPAGR